MFAGQRTYTTPAGFGVGELARAADKGDLAMTERIQVVECTAGAPVVVDDDGADMAIFQFAPDNRGGNVVLLKIGEHIDVDEQPVGENDESLDAAVEQHFEIALETAALIVDIGENGQERRLV